MVSASTIYAVFCSLLLVSFLRNVICGANDFIVSTSSENACDVAKKDTSTDKYGAGYLVTYKVKKGFCDGYIETPASTYFLVYLSHDSFTPATIIPKVTVQISDSNGSLLSGVFESGLITAPRRNFLYSTRSSRDNDHVRVSISIDGVDSAVFPNVVIEKIASAVCPFDVAKGESAGGLVQDSCYFTSSYGKRLGTGFIYTSVPLDSAEQYCKMHSTNGLKAVLAPVPTNGSGPVFGTSKVSIGGSADSSNYLYYDSATKACTYGNAGPISGYTKTCPTDKYSVVCSLTFDPKYTSIGDFGATSVAVSDSSMLFSVNLKKNSTNATIDVEFYMTIGSSYYGAFFVRPSDGSSADSTFADLTYEIRHGTDVIGTGTLNNADIKARKIVFTKTFSYQNRITLIYSLPSNSALEPIGVLQFTKADSCVSSLLSDGTDSCVFPISIANSTEFSTVNTRCNAVVTGSTLRVIVATDVIYYKLFWLNGANPVYYSLFDNVKDILLGASASASAASASAASASPSAASASPQSQISSLKCDSLDKGYGVVTSKDCVGVAFCTFKISSITDSIFDMIPVIIAVVGSVLGLGIIIGVISFLMK